MGPETAQYGSIYGDSVIRIIIIIGSLYDGYGARERGK